MRSRVIALTDGLSVQSLCYNLCTISHRHNSNMDLSRGVHTEERVQTLILIYFYNIHENGVVKA